MNFGDNEQKERLFLALPVYSFFHQEIDAFLKLHKNDELPYKWTPVSSLHITLHFFGDLAVQDKERVIAAMPAALDGVQAVQVRLEGIAAFPSQGDPRIIYAGVHSDTMESLLPLHDSVCAALKKLGFETQTRTYRPHVTLCRIKVKDQKDWLKQAWRFPKTYQKTVSQVALYRSRLAPSGARHEVCQTWDLI